MGCPARAWVHLCRAASWPFSREHWERRSAGVVSCCPRVCSAPILSGQSGGGLDLDALALALYYDGLFADWRLLSLLAIDIACSSITITVMLLRTGAAC